MPSNKRSKRQNRTAKKTLTPEELKGLNDIIVAGKVAKATPTIAIICLIPTILDVLAIYWIVKYQLVWKMIPWLSVGTLSLVSAMMLTQVSLSLLDDTRRSIDKIGRMLKLNSIGAMSLCIWSGIQTSVPLLYLFGVIAWVDNNWGGLTSKFWVIWSFIVAVISSIIGSLIYDLLKRHYQKTRVT